MTRFAVPAMVLLMCFVQGCANEPDMAEAQAAQVREVKVSVPQVHAALERLAMQWPAATQTPGADDLTLLLAASLPYVYDGFTYSLWADRGRHQVWLTREGGFAGVKEWVGPVNEDDRQVRSLLTETAFGIPEGTRH